MTEDEFLDLCKEIVLHAGYKVYKPSGSHHSNKHTLTELHKATARIEDRSARQASTRTTGYAGRGGAAWDGGSVMAKNFVGGVMII